MYIIMIMKLVWCMVVLMVQYVQGQDRAQVCGEPGVGECSCNVVFMLDISGSVSDKDGQQEVTNLKMFTKSLVSKLIAKSANVNIAVIAFDTTAYEVSPFTQSEAVLHATINTVRETNGWTNYIDAFKMETEMFAEFLHQSRYTDTAILITDGFPTVAANGVTIRETDYSAAANETRKVMKSNITALITDQVIPSPTANKWQLMTIRVSQDSDTEFLRSLTRNISGQPIGQSFRCTGNNCLSERNPLDIFFEDFSQLDGSDADRIKDEIASMVCTLKEGVDLLDSSTPAPTQPSSTPAPTQCKVTVMVDMSGSLNSNQVSQVKRVLINLYRSSALRNKRTALIQFADKPDAIFSLRSNTDSSRAGIEQEINTKLYSGGWTSSASAFRYVKDNVLDNNGDVKNVVLMITDGYPTRMIDGTRIREDESAGHRKLVEDECVNEKRNLDSQYFGRIAHCAVVISGKENHNMAFMSRMVSDSNAIVQSAFAPNGDEQLLARNVQGIIQNLCSTATIEV